MSYCTSTAFDFITNWITVKSNTNEETPNQYKQSKLVVSSLREDGCSTWRIGSWPCCTLTWDSGAWQMQVFSGQCSKSLKSLLISFPPLQRLGAPLSPWLFPVTGRVSFQIVCRLLSDVLHTDCPQRWWNFRGSIWDSDPQLHKSQVPPFYLVLCIFCQPFPGLLPLSVEVKAFSS